MRLNIWPSPMAPRWLAGWLLAALILAGCGNQNQAGSSTATAGPAITVVAATTQEPAATETSEPAATAAVSETVAAGATEQPSTESTTATITSETPATQTAEEASTPEAAATSEAATPDAASGGAFQNPVFRTNFADPYVLNVDGTYYAYATNASGRNIQVARSQDLVDWELLRDAMPALPSWAQLGGSLVWAPEVARIGAQYLLYFTARDKKSNKQCVGVAVSDKPEGRFKDTRTEPLVCQANEGGTIDASPFFDDGKWYLYFKNDGNCCSMPTYLYVQELAPDGLSLVGEPTRLVRNDKAWEGRVVEAPTMWKQDGKYYLFFSANDYGGPAYAVGYATCESALGPCEDAPENPILKSRTQEPLVIGPGHQTIVLDDDGEPWLVYHVWEVAAGRKTDRRLMWIDQLVWEDGKPRVKGPTTEPQPLP